MVNQIFKSLRLKQFFFKNNPKLPIIQFGHPPNKGGHPEEAISDPKGDQGVKPRLYNWLFIGYTIDKCKNSESGDPKAKKAPMTEITDMMAAATKSNGTEYRYPSSRQLLWASCGWVCGWAYLWRCLIPVGLVSVEAVFRSSVALSPPESSTTQCTKEATQRQRHGRRYPDIAWIND